MTAAAKIKALGAALRKHNLGDTPTARAMLVQFSSGLRTKRAARSQEKLAAKIGISVQQYSNIERAINWPSLPVYLRICEVLKLRTPPLMK